MDPLTQLEVVERIIIALVLGAVIGFEREKKDKPAGLRTYALVCEGAALFMIGSILLGEEVAANGGTTYDPSRIGSTIVQASVSSRAASSSPAAIRFAISPRRRVFG